MKLFWSSISLLLLSLISGFGYLQENAATLEETISWIEGKLSYTDNEDGITNSTLNVKIDNATKTIIVTTLFREKAGNPRQYVKQYVPIKSINPNNIKIVESDGYHWIYLYTNSGQNLIKWEAWFVKEGPESKITEMQKELQIRIPPSESSKNPDLANRLKKALIHLIKLSGGKGEPF